jgi:EAL domain-containing protein (putative c-di-GMP-specific phosphodiesterase class I)
VLLSACREGRQLQESGFPDLQIAVNFSARQLCQPRVAARVQRILQETGFEPEQLVLELTESTLFEDTEDVRAALWSLKALGVRLALDDFGTGYSGLASLKRMPVDTLKIDQSFIRDIGKDRESEALVLSMLAMGQ